MLVQVLIVLMDVGSDLEAPDSGGWTPLHCACAAARASCVNALIARGADPTAVTPEGQRPSSLIGTASAVVLSGLVGLVDWFEGFLWLVLIVFCLRGLLDGWMVYLVGWLIDMVGLFVWFGGLVGCLVLIG